MRWWRRIQTPQRPFEEETAHTTMEPATSAIAGRLALTMLGAVGMFVGPFLEWFSPGGMKGVQLPVRTYVRPVFIHEPHVYASAGMVMLALGALAILGLTMSSGWLTRVAGGGGIIALVLYAISLQREPGAGVSAAGGGAWLSLGGAIVSLVGGLAATRHKHPRMRTVLGH